MTVQRLKACSSGYVQSSCSLSWYYTDVGFTRVARRFNVRTWIILRLIVNLRSLPLVDWPRCGPCSDPILLPSRPVAFSSRLPVKSFLWTRRTWLRGYNNNSIKEELLIAHVFTTSPVFEALDETNTYLDPGEPSESGISPQINQSGRSGSSPQFRIDGGLKTGGTCDTISDNSDEPSLKTKDGVVIQHIRWCSPNAHRLRSNSSPDAVGGSAVICPSARVSKIGLQTGQFRFVSIGGPSLWAFSFQRVLELHSSLIESMVLLFSSLVESISKRLKQIFSYLACSTTRVGDRTRNVSSSPQIRDLFFSL